MLRALIGIFKFVELVTHPHVLEASVVARQDPKWGERPMAFITLRPQYTRLWEGRHHEFEKDLKQHARARLPGFACPEWVTVVQDLPVSSYFMIQVTPVYPTSENFHWEDRKDRTSQGCSQVVKLGLESTVHLLLDILSKSS